MQKKKKVITLNKKLQFFHERYLSGKNLQKKKRKTVTKFANFRENVEKSANLI